MYKGGRLQYTRRPQGLKKLCLLRLLQPPQQKRRLQVGDRQLGQAYVPFSDNNGRVMAMEYWEPFSPR